MATFVMLVGLPASGKSTYAESLNNYIVHSSDKLREELYSDINDQSHNDELFEELHKRIIRDLRDGKNVAYDACNISRKRRMAFLNILKDKKIPCRKKCVVIVTELDMCLKQNKQRDRFVPKDVIIDMYKQIQVPAFFEGWDEIELKGNFGYKEIMDEVVKLGNFNQYNPHHKLTLGAHLYKAFEFVIDEEPVIAQAAILHDIGKPFTKVFHDYKGNQTDIAHYYGHENVGAYESLFIQVPFANILERANIIQYHMYPYVWEKDNNEKMRLKWKKIWGEELYDKIMLVHRADKLSH